MNTKLNINTIEENSIPLNKIDFGEISIDKFIQIHIEPNSNLEIGQPINVTSLIQQSMGITVAELYEEVVTNEKKTSLCIHGFAGIELLEHQEISRALIPLTGVMQIAYLSMIDEAASLYMQISTTQCVLIFTDTLAGYNSVVAPLVEAIESKQDAITDLETIRQGAAKGATALQSYTEQYKGTVTGVTINGETKNPSSGVVDLGYINKQLLTSTSPSMTLSPNIYYRNTNTSLSKLTITLDSVSNSNIINEYFVEFTTSSSGTTVSLPSTIKWANEEEPTFEESTTYQISIVNDLGVVTKFK